jgi:hypothetical protein
MARNLEFRPGFYNTYVVHTCITSIALFRVPTAASAAPVDGSSPRRRRVSDPGRAEEEVYDPDGELP